MIQHDLRHAVLWKKSCAKIAANTSFGFDSLTRGTKETRAPPCVKVPYSSRVPTHANSFVIGTTVINKHTQSMREMYAEEGEGEEEEDIHIHIQ
jgi:hypothetical protein